MNDDLTSGRAGTAAGPGAYIARDRLVALASGTALADVVDGTAVLADIAGFTSLTEFLHERHGPRDGAEVLIDYTNRVYGCLIREVERFGGSVIDFAGDAILCWFDGAGEDAVLRAVAAALAMRDGAPSSVGLAPDGWHGSLALKVSVAAGPVRRMALGDPAIQRMDAIAGTAIDRLVDLDRLVRPGAVVADRDSLGAAAARLRWDAASPHVVDGLLAAVVPCPAAPAPALPVESLLPWIAAPIRRHVVHARHAGFLCEIRRAAVVFLQFDRRDYQHDPDLVPLLDGFVRHAQAVAQRRGGHLLQLSLNDKGSYFYLVFGAPVAHENTVARAVGAALDLLAPHPAGAPFGSLRAGVASGYARIGIHGAPQRRAYGVVGGAVNLAARLMNAAHPGELLAPAWLADAVPELAAHPRGTLHLKGMATPCEVVSLTPDGGAPGRQPDAAAARMPLSGHAAALSTLETLLDRLRDGSGATVLVEGEPGMGKTVLLRSVAAQARARGIDVAVAGATELEQTTLYAPWVRLFAALFPTGAASGAALGDALLRLDPDLARAAPLVAQVLHRDIAHDAALTDMAPQMRAHLTRAALTALVAEAARRAPLLLVLEDVHWLDSASLSLLAAVAAAGAPLLLLLSARAGLAEALPLPADADLQRIRLEPMPAATLLAIACARIGAHAVTDDAAAFLLDKAGGNPYFAEELALAMRKLGRLEVTHGLCRLSAATPLHSATLPDSIEGVVTARLDRLAPDQLRLAKLASAIGRPFDARLLADLEGALDDAPGADGVATVANPDRVAGLLAQLAALDVLVADEETPGSYRFRHAIARDVAYHLMLAGQRSRLHRWLALWHERHRAGELDALLPVLAGHWTQVAADPAADQDTLARAIELLHRAAMQAFRANALGESARHLQGALSLLAQRPADAAAVALETEFQSLLGYCLSTQRGFGDPAVERAYRRGYALAQQAEPTPPLGFSLYGLFSFYASRGEYDPARRLALQMLTLGDAIGDPALSAFAHHSRGIIALLGDDPEEALANLDRSAALAAGLRPDAFFGFASELPVFNSAWQVLALARLERFDAARAVFAAALQAGAQAPHAHAFVLSFAMLPVWERDLDGTLRRCDELDALSRRNGFDLYAAIARVYRGWAMAEGSGDPAGATLAESALPLLRAVGLNSFLPMFLGLVAQARLSSGDPAGARAALAEAEGVSATAGANFYGARLRHVRRLSHQPSEIL